MDKELLEAGYRAYTGEKIDVYFNTAICHPTYEGPFVINNIFSGGAMILTTMDGDDLPHPANTDIVKRYYA